MDVVRTRSLLLLIVCAFVCATSAQNVYRHGTTRRGLLPAPPTPSNFRPPLEMWFYQKLDHFNGIDRRQWQQRYFVNQEFFKDGGPIFLMLGGEIEANRVWLSSGAWIDYAKLYNATLVMLEHRYYGKSQPVPNLTTQNLRYLSSRQALADVAKFIEGFRFKFNLTTNKLVTFGGSYSGSLSAWFRLKYPTMVDGAVASSAPLFAKTDFGEYLNVVNESLYNNEAGTGPQCTAAIRNATSTMFEWWGQPDKREKMYSIFKLCAKINHGSKLDSLDMAGFFQNLATNFADVVQFNNDNIFEGVVGTNITIPQLCNIMVDENRGSPIQRYADVNSLMLEDRSENCLEYRYTKVISDLKTVEWNSSATQGDRQWLYQTCTEFGWSMTDESHQQPFSPGVFFFPFNFTYDKCDDLFKSFDIEPNMEETNRYYGGYNYQGTRVVLPNGSRDPWYPVSITNNTDLDVTAIFIQGTAHGADMFPPSPRDPPGLVEARHRITDLIGQWIS